MNKFLYLAVAALCLFAVSCGEANKMVLKASGLSASGNAYVFDMVENKTLDTLAIENGGFTYTYELTGEPKVLIVTDMQSFSYNVIAEKGTLTLVGDTGMFKGASLNNRLVEFVQSYRQAGTDLEDQKMAIVESLGEDGEFTEEIMSELQQIDKMQADLFANVTREFYEVDKESVVGALELLSTQSAFSKEEFAALYEQGGEVVKNFAPLKNFFEAEARMEELSAGGMYVDLAGVNPRDESQVLKLSDYVGKDNYVLLDFWASWCGPCRAAMPEIKRLNEIYGSKGLEVIGLVVSDKIDDHLKSADELGVTWTQIFDNEGTFIETYGVKGIPTLMLLDKDGTILVRSNDKDEIVEKLEDLLGK